MDKRRLLAKHVHRPGSLFLGELIGCRSLPDNPRDLQKHMEKAAELMGAHVVQSVFHQFNPYGLSGVVIIKESHLAIHTWPESNYAAVDLFSCGKMQFSVGINYLAKEFGAESTRMKEVLRDLVAPIIPIYAPTTKTKSVR